MGEISLFALSKEPARRIFLNPPQLYNNPIPKMTNQQEKMKRAFTHYFVLLCLCSISTWLNKLVAFSFFFLVKAKVKTKQNE